MSWADLYTRRYSDNYNCSSFATEAFNAIHGTGVADFNTLLANNQLSDSATPEGCFVLVDGGVLHGAHVGVYHCGKVLHLTQRGVVAEPLQTFLMGRRTWKFAKPTP